MVIHSVNASLHCYFCILDMATDMGKDLPRRQLELHPLKLPFKPHLCLYSQLADGLTVSSRLLGRNR